MKLAKQLLVLTTSTKFHTFITFNVLQFYKKMTWKTLCIFQIR